MSEKKILMGEELLTSFDPEAFLRVFFTDPATVQNGVEYFTFKTFHEIFQSGIKGKQLLDLSTGPIPHSVLCAAPFVDQISLTDYAPANREYLNLWWKGTLPGKDFLSPVAQLILKMENREEMWQQRVEEVKSKIIGIFPLDLSKDDVMAPNYFPQYDVITGCYTFEVSAYTMADYPAVARRVYGMLKPGGHLVAGGALEESFYQLEGKSYHNLYITGDEVKRYFIEAGFEIKLWKEHAVPSRETNTITDMGNQYVMHCVKRE